MLTAYTTTNDTFNKISVNQQSDLPPDMVWLDLVNPTEQDRQWVRETYGQELQFIEELGEIEASERFYRDEHGLHLHLYFLLSGTDSTRNVNVGFTINRGRLYTLRSDDLPEFLSFYSLARKNPEMRNGAIGIILGIISTRIGMMADLYGRLEMELEPISLAIFRGDPHTMSHVLESLARIEDINGKARLGLLENKHAQSNLARSAEAAGQAEAINEIALDVDSLMTFSTFLAERAKFLMDAALGMINMSQNKRLNIFTVLSVILMPPTLIASIYGMNFRHMPEMEWYYGYPLALALMLIVAIGPILYLKRKDWL
ncbi:MAG: magnesium transporter CorA [Betaproteobacteria bacterium]|nr:magnesium transporter CorA [Betaproteobacteria bacterium]